MIHLQMIAYDLGSREEEILPGMICARTRFPLLLFGKCIYVFGGYNSSGWMNECER